MGRLLSILAVLVVLCVAALLWSGGGVEKRADFAFINRGDIITLDLNKMSYMQDFRITFGIREGLYTYDVTPQGVKAIPAVAHRHELSDDKKTWTFHLRPDARWSNGDPVTAHDFVFSWRHMLHEKGDYTYLFFYIRNAREYYERYAAALGKPDVKPMDFREVGIKAIDDRVLRVELVNPVSYLLDVLAFCPFYPRHEKSMKPFERPHPLDARFVMYDAAYTRPPQVVTNGPFMLTKWEFRRRLRLEKNPYYWDKPNVVSDTIDMIVNEQETSQFLQYETGGVDWITEVSAGVAAELKEKGRTKTDLRVSPAFGTAFLTVNCGPKVPGHDGPNPLADVRVRHALAMAVDKQAIVTNVTRMGERPAMYFVPPGTLPGYEQTRPGLPYDAPRARQLLAEAGFPGGRGFPRLSLLYNSNNPTRRDFCQMIKSQWKQNLGIDFELVSLEVAIYSDALEKKEYAVGAAAWYGDYSDASTFTDYFLSNSGNNNTSWGPKEYDDLLARAAAEPDAAKRLDMLEEAEGMIIAQAPILPLYYYTNSTLHRDDVVGIVPNPKLLTMLKVVGKKKAQ